ncbi:MAG: hypothetical protein HY885_08540 [Deltaproteobacteria bacterium]|nr:hypothetical protein [Deltaproteobacteria bacterium]
MAVVDGDARTFGQTPSTTIWEEKEIYGLCAACLLARSLDVNGSEPQQAFSVLSAKYVILKGIAEYFFRARTGGKYMEFLQKIKKAAGRLPVA